MVVNANEHEIGNSWRILLTNQGLREEMGKKAESLVHEQFATESVAKKMLKLFSDISNIRHEKNYRMSG
jgi:hypothetical protein